MKRNGLQIITGMALALVGAGASQIRAQEAPATVPASPVNAPTTFQSVFGSSQTPISLRWGDIQSGWFKFTASEQTEGGVYAQLYGSLLGANVYYTQGTTIMVGSETYLVAYRPESKQMDIAGLMNSYTKPPKPAPLMRDTPMALCLLNVRTMGSLKEITALDPQRESEAVDDVRQDVQHYFSRQESRRNSLVSETNLKILGQAVLAYAQKRHQTLPPLKSAAQAKAALFPFAKSNSPFADPETHQPYQPNRALSGHSLALISNRHEMIVYYDPGASDGLRSVLFLDGHTQRISNADWPRAKRASKIH